MKSLKLMLPFLLLLAFAFVFAGCPGKNMSSDDGMTKEDSMSDDGMMEDDGMMADDGMMEEK